VVEHTNKGEEHVKTILIVGIMLFVGVLVHNRIKDEYQAGYAEGLRVALKTNPPSEDLEVACAGLWVGQQNKKYWEKTK
jgi:hypothetical protein